MTDPDPTVVIPTREQIAELKAAFEAYDVDRTTPGRISAVLLAARAIVSPGPDVLPGMPTSREELEAAARRGLADSRLALREAKIRGEDGPRAPGTVPAPTWTETGDGMVRCHYCSNPFRRSGITIHQSRWCPNRPGAPAAVVIPPRRPSGTPPPDRRREPAETASRETSRETAPRAARAPRAPRGPAPAKAKVEPPPMPGHVVEVVEERGDDDPRMAPVVAARNRRRAEEQAARDAAVEVAADRAQATP